MIKKLVTLLEELLDEDFETLEKMKSFKESENWDSLNYVRLVVSLESEFKIKLSKEDIQQILSVEGIRSVLFQHGVEGIEI